MSAARAFFTGPAATSFRGPALARAAVNWATFPLTSDTRAGWTRAGVRAKALTALVATVRCFTDFGASVSLVRSTCTRLVWSSTETGFTWTTSGWLISLKRRTLASTRRCASTLRLSFGGSGSGCRSLSTRTTTTSSSAKIEPIKVSQKMKSRAR